MEANTVGAQVNQHYGMPDLSQRILGALSAAGKDPERLTPDDLATFDHFHTAGKPASEALARLAGIRDGAYVLDVGGGLGGAARYLAVEFGCQVTVLDLTEEYIRAGEMLTERTGISDRVRFRVGDATRIPFPDQSFDVVWTQHSSMNIQDKERKAAEIYRVLRPGGRYALHEIMAGVHSPIHFPVPWARAPETSFLRPPSEVRALISAAGFREIVWEDTSQAAIEWFSQRASIATNPPPLSLALLLGGLFESTFMNQVRNLEEDRIRIIQAVFERP